MAEEMVVVRGDGSEEEEEGECNAVVVVVVVVVFRMLPGPRKRQDRLFDTFGRRKVQELLFEVHLFIPLLFSSFSHPDLLFFFSLFS